MSVDPPEPVSRIDGHKLCAPVPWYGANILDLAKLVSAASLFDSGKLGWKNTFSIAKFFHINN